MGKEMAQEKTKDAAQGTNIAARNKNPSLWKRFNEYLKKPSITDWSIAVFTAALVATTIYQFSIMKGQLDEMRLDQRPWIKVSVDLLPLHVGSAEIASLHVINTGKTAATKVNTNYTTETVVNGETPKLDFSTGTNMNSWVAVFFPEPKPADVVVVRMRHLQGNEPGIDRNDVRIAEQAPLDPITQQDVGNFNGGKIFFVVYVRFDYFDASGVAHWTQFCGWYAGGKTEHFVSSRKCAQYNAVDSNK